MDRRPHRLIPFIDPLLEDELVISKLTTDEIGKLRNHKPKLLRMCAQLSEYSVPSTLIHGDLHLGNIAISTHGFTFFDWTDACVAHPFMDMLIIFNEEDREARTHLRDAYLEMWTKYESMERLRELWSLCEVVHAIHHAVSYQYILHHTEERSRNELGGAPSFQLRKALQYLNEMK